MRTKLSKRFLSAFLAIMMVVTSIPIMSLSAYAIDVEATDPAVVEVADAMQKFEDKLMSQGAFTNVDAAYNAYVDCQKAIDAYIYGGEANALSGKAAAMTEAVNNITDFVPKKASAVPTFPNSTVGDMQEYVTEVPGKEANAGTISQILYANQATVGEGKNAGQVGTRMVLSTDITVLYDGSTPIKIPVMVDAYKSNSATPDVESGDKTAYSKTRHFYACYPSPQANGTADDTTFQLVDKWRSGAGQDANWNWNWYTKDVNHDPAYNYSTGCATDNKQNTDNRSSDLVVNRTGGVGNRKYTSVERYFSNILNYVGGDFDGSGKQYTIGGWYASSGDGINSKADDKYMNGNTINIVNYKYLIDAMAKNGDKMKSIDPAEFSEGGLSDYITAMEAATDWDPTSYFTSSNGYTNCVNAMSPLVRAMNEASTTNKNSTSYAELRAEMTEGVRGTYSDTNTAEDGTLRYTAESWSEFAAAYEAAQAVMAQCNDSGYTATNCSALATTLKEKYNALETNVEKVDTAALIEAIDAFESYDNIFTTETYNAAAAAVDAAKVAVWGSVDDYGKKDHALALTPENTEIVAYHLAKINTEVEGLRINMDAMVTTSEGLYSLRSAIALQDNVKDHSDDYGNYSVFSSAISAAYEYIVAASAAPFTDYNTQLEEYRSEIIKVVEAYNGLQYSFVKIPNGTVCSNSAMTTMTPLTSNDQGRQEISFSYSNTGVVLKTTHDGATVPYGKVGVVFGTTIKDKDNNMLDSISINATQPKIADNSGKQHANSGASWTATPNALDGNTYAGCLSHNNFSITNLRYQNKSSNCNPARMFTYADGTVVNDPQVALNYDAEAILGKTEGAAAYPGKGGFFVRTSNDQLATIEFLGKLNYTFAATTPQTLTRTTTPASATYQLGGTKFGAVTLYHCQNLQDFVYYDWFTSDITGETINTSCTVIDISNLTDLVALCNEELANGANKYTEATWTAFQTALVNAQADMNYKVLSASQIVSQSVTRYQNLWDAYQALEIRDVVSTFNYKDENGVDTSTVITTKYGETIDMNAVNAIVVPDYDDENFTYTFSNWSPAVSTSAMVIDRVYTAEYSIHEKVADFSAFDAALQSVKNLLVDNTLSVTALNKAASDIAALTPDYINYTAEQKENTKKDQQADIDAQTVVLNQIAADLTADAANIAKVDYSALEAARLQEAVDKKYKYDDMYIAENSEIGDSTQKVTILDQSVDGQIYTTKEEVDAAVSNALNNKTIRTYTVYINGTACGTVDYGTPVVVDSDGTLHANVTDTDANTEGKENVAWFYSYAAPSTNNTKSNETYMISAPSFGFVVKGDTYLRTEATTAQDTGYTVTFKANVAGKIKTFDVQYVTDGQLTMPEAPAYAFYVFDGYSNSANPGDVISVTSNMTITAQYAVEEATTFTVDFYEGISAFDSADYISRNSYKYNELVELKASFVPYLWVKAETNDTTDLHIVAYGSDTYSFYACQDLSRDGLDGIVALSEEDYQMITQDVLSEAYRLFDTAGNPIVAEDDGVGNYTYPDPQPAVTVLDNVIRIYNSDKTLNKMSLIGTFALPEGYTMVETGFLFTSTIGSDLTLENVGTNGIVRMKTARYTVGNQFVVNVKAPTTTVSFEYVGYTVVKDSQGNTSTIYSTKGGETNFDPTV